MLAPLIPHTYRREPDNFRLAGLPSYKEPITYTYIYAYILTYNIQFPTYKALIVNARKKVTICQLSVDSTVTCFIMNNHCCNILWKL